MGPAASHFTGGCCEVVDVRCSQVSHIYFTLLHHSASFCIILHHAASFCIFVFLPYASGDSLMSCPGHPGHWVVERPCCLSAGAAAGNCHAWTLFWTIAIHCNGHSAHAVARGYRFIRFIQFFRFWFFRFTDERFHHWDVRDAILRIYCCYLLRVTVIDSIDCLGPRGRNSFVKHMKAFCDKRNKRCCTKYILKY